MSGLLGRKIGMTGIYSPEGEIIPVTVMEAGPCQVIAIRTIKKNGYDALQLGFGIKKEKHLRKPEVGYFKKQNVKPSSVVREFKNFDVSKYKVGDELTVELFKEGDKVKLTGKSKGKGFQGVMKRHGFHGTQRTHGQGDRERAPGSIGQSSWPSRVLKGTRMAGRTGDKKITVSNLEVVRVIKERNILFVKGAVPGSINSIVEVKK